MGILPPSNVMQVRITKRVSSDYLFMNQSGGPLDQDNLHRRLWDKAVKESGVRKCTMYNTRHAFAAWALAAGGNINSYLSAYPVSSGVMHGIGIGSRCPWPRKTTWPGVPSAPRTLRVPLSIQGGTFAIARGGIYGGVDGEGNARWF